MSDEFGNDPVGGLIYSKLHREFADWLFADLYSDLFGPKRMTTHREYIKFVERWRTRFSSEEKKLTKFASDLVKTVSGDR